LQLSFWDRATFQLHRGYYIPKESVVYSRDDMVSMWFVDTCRDGAEWWFTSFVSPPVISHSWNCQICNKGMWPFKQLKCTLYHELRHLFHHVKHDVKAAEEFWFSLLLCLWLIFVDSLIITPSFPNYLSVLIGTQILRNLWGIYEIVQLGSNPSLHKLFNELFFTQNGVINNKIWWFDQAVV
jgi:hypothetical protein